MGKPTIRILSIFLTVALLIGMLPMEVLGAEIRESMKSGKVEAGTTVVVEEISAKRTQHAKEFLLNSGLHMAVTYPNPVHYSKDGKWLDVDSTLKMVEGGFTNTADAWSVLLPETIDSKTPISISLDDHTLSFKLTGVVCEAEKATAEIDATDATVPAIADEIAEKVPADASDEAVETSAAEDEPTADTKEVTVSEETEPEETASLPEKASPYTSVDAKKQEANVKEIKPVPGKVEQLDYSNLKKEAEYPETILEKVNSRLKYSDIYPETDLIYDLSSGKLKESIVMRSYDATVQGYRYALETGKLTPKLSEDGSIALYDGDGKAVINMPAPFLVDAAHAYCNDIKVTLAEEDGSYILTYTLPAAWLSAEDRAFPVTLDPVVSASWAVTDVLDRTVASASTFSYAGEALFCGRGVSYGKLRSFVKFDKLPAITSSDVIVGAYVDMLMWDSYGSQTIVEVHKVQSEWDSQTITWEGQPDHDPNIEDYAVVTYERNRLYRWDVTDIARQWYATGKNTGILFKAPTSVENTATNNYKYFYSSDYSIYMAVPYLLIMFRNNNGLESYWDYTSASAGRAGTGSVNNFTGNLVWTKGDIGFGGARMPVSISHVYNLNDVVASTASGNNSNASGGNSFGMGVGWRTNYNQLVYQWSTDSRYYIWEDSDGTDHYFLYDSPNTYKDEDGLELTLTVNNSSSQKYCITEKYGAKSYFDANGRLIKIENNQATKSSINITYTSANEKLINTIADGVGRVYQFTYTNNLLSGISYFGTGDTEISHVSFGYDGDNHLTSVTDPDGNSSTYTYDENHLLLSAQDIDGYKLTYSYNTVSSNWQPYRVQKVEESQGAALGSELNFAYSHNQTVITDHNGNQNILQFNDFGNLICTQDDEGRAAFAQYAFSTDAQKNSNTDATKKGNQLRLSSELQNTVANLMDNNDCRSFSSIDWSCTAGTTATSVTSKNGEDDSAFEVQVATPGTGGITSRAYSVPANQTQTFSCFVCSNVAVRLKADDGANAVYSDYQKADNNWYRLQVSYTNNAEDSQSVTYSIEADCASSDASSIFYVDNLQLEVQPTASRYNLINNGDFRFGISHWSASGCTADDAVTAFATSGAPQLDGHMFQMVGNPTGDKSLTQTVYVSGQAGEYYTICGWAKGNSVPLSDSGREFAIKCVLVHTDNTRSDPVYARFNADSNEWQYSANGIFAKKAFKAIEVSLVYNRNANTVYFDGIQLYKNGLGDKLEYDSDGNIISIFSSDKKETSYEYTANDLTKEILPGGVQYKYDYDSYHNVTKATTPQGQAYLFAYDAYGNNTSVSTTVDGKTMISTACYTDDHNRIASQTDALGNVTLYAYNADTNMLEWVQYPNDTEATRTEYTYDNMYRMATVRATTDTNSQLGVNYTYNSSDVLSQVQTATSTYNFTYGDFSLRTCVSVGDQALVRYRYTNDRNRYLDKLDYGNGDSVQYTYDAKGRVTSLTYEDEATVIYAYDNNGALASVIDSASGTAVTTSYDYMGRKTSYRQTNRDVDMAMTYQYDSATGLLASVRDTINGHTRGIYYTYDDNQQISIYRHAKGSRKYTYDSFNRISSYVTKYNTTQVLSTQYTFEGTGTSTSNRVSTIRQACKGDSVTYSYTYDANGNILSVSDGTNTTSYVYDSANQLIRENNQAGGFTHTWEYDNAGNILNRKEYSYTTGTLGAPTNTVTYTYGDTQWGDLLTAYNGQAITYDQIGNPLSDGTWNYTWQHGRQLASMTDGNTTWEYTYNADGLRTKRTDGTTTYTYAYYDGILQYMQVGDDEYYFSFAPDGTPMGMVKNDTPYYYVTNLQGDVVAIVNHLGYRVVQYTYDAWGNVLSITGARASTIGAENPIRYRGYVYDAETGLYYLQNRYYSPETGRFINADAYTSTGQGILGNNMFSYCENNPINLKDASGEFLTFIAAALAGAAVNVITTYIAAKVTNQSYSLTDGIVATVSGACNAIPVVGPFISGIITGGYTGYMAYSHGATLGEAIMCGTFAGILTTASIGNLANAAGSTLKVAENAFVDLVFGTGYNSMSAAVYKVVTDKPAQETSTKSNANKATNRNNNQARYRRQYKNYYDPSNYVYDCRIF